MPAAGFTPTFLYMTGPLIIWAARFLAVYSFTAISCSRGWAEVTLAGIGVIPFVIGALTILALLGCAAFLIRALNSLRVPAAAMRLAARPVDAEERGEALRENARFVHYLTATVAASSVIAVLWETLPVFLVPVCR